MIPVLANGFGDLHARSRWEDEVIKGHTDKLKELNEKSSKLLRELDIDLIAKLTGLTISEIKNFKKQLIVC